MRSSAARGGPRHLTEPLRFQVLRVGFEISTNEPAIERQLRFLVQSAVQPESPRATIAYTVARRGGAYEILRDGVAADVQFDPVGVLEAVYRCVQEDALAAWPEAAVLRAITGSWHGERFLVVGEGLRDRSRLALHLICRGAEIEADDLAILHDGSVTAYPRALRVYGEEGSLPPGSPSKAELPSVGEGGPWALDLAAAAIGWRITTAAVERIVLLEPNYGGQTRLRPVPHYEAARTVMSGCDPRGNVQEMIRSVGQLVAPAQCSQLWLGATEEVGDFWPPAWRGSLPR